MKLLLVTGLYPPDIGGPATYAKIVVEELPRRGIEVDVLPFSSVRHLPRIVRHLSYTWRIFRFAGSADIVFVQDTVSTGIPAFIAAILRARPLVVRVPGDYAWEQGKQRWGVVGSLDDFQTRRYGMRVEFFRYLRALVPRLARRVIVASVHYSRIVQGWGVPASKIVVIPNAIANAVPVLPGQVPQGPIVLTAGRLVAGKGYEDLIKMMPHMPGWNLVIAGDGPLRENLERLVKGEDLENRVTFVGSVSPAEMAGWYRTARAFVLNSESESFSYVVLEAMAAGVPVIATRVGAIPELIDDGKEGVLVTPSDKDAIRAALREVLEDPAKWQERTTAAKQKAAEYSVDRIMDRLAEELKAL